MFHSLEARSNPLKKLLRQFYIPECWRFQHQRHLSYSKQEQTAGTVLQRVSFITWTRKYSGERPEMVTSLLRNIVQHKINVGVCPRGCPKEKAAVWHAVTERAQSKPGHCIFKCSQSSGSGDPQCHGLALSRGELWGPEHARLAGKAGRAKVSSQWNPPLTSGVTVPVKAFLGSGGGYELLL